MSIELQNAQLIFKDILMFSSPCDLSSFLRQWNTKSEKSIFPYSFFDSIESVSKQLSFPPKEAFKNELKKYKNYAIVAQGMDTISILEYHMELENA